MNNLNTNLFVYKYIYTLTLVFVFIINISSLKSEEYSIRKKKTSKKQEAQIKSLESNNPIGFSRENNKISNQFWLEEGAIYSPENLDNVSIPTQTETPQVTVTDTPPPTADQKIKEDNNKITDKSISQKPNVVVHFLTENKKVLLILGLIAIFAIYRLRGDSPSNRNQNTRIFSKFRNK